MFTKTGSGSQYLLNPNNPIKRGWDTSFVLEFDVVTVGTLVPNISESNKGLFSQRIVNMGGTDGCHFKLVYDGTTFTPYINGEVKTNYIVTTTHQNNFGISFNNNGAFENCILYKTQ